MRRTSRINASKPHLWKADVAASVDQFNQWFMRFAPDAFRSTRTTTTERVKEALLATNDLRALNAATLKANPGALPTLRMCAAPPLAVDRLIGLAGVSKHLVGRMEKDKLPTHLPEAELDSELIRICRIVSNLLDNDVFPWLENRLPPTELERDRASTIIADRLCRNQFMDVLRDARRRSQLFALVEILDGLGYREAAWNPHEDLKRFESGSYATNISVPIAMGSYSPLRFDAVIRAKSIKPNRMPMLVDIASPHNGSESQRMAAEFADKRRTLEMNYRPVPNQIILLGGCIDSGMIGSMAAESLDWVWQHRIEDMRQVCSYDATKLGLPAS